MPKKITKSTFMKFRLTDFEISEFSLIDLIGWAKAMNATEQDIEELKSYRRLLRVRSYGKEFRQREKNEIKKLKMVKKALKIEASQLRTEINNVKDSIGMQEILDILDSMENTYTSQTNCNQHLF